MANTKIKFDFNQTRVTVATAEFLLGIYNPVEEDEDSTELRDHLQVAIEGKYLKVKDANFLLQKILSAMIINDNVDEDAIKNNSNSNSKICFYCFLSLFKTFKLKF